MMKEKLLFYLLLFISIVMFTLSIYVIHHTFHILTTYEKTEGLLVEYEEVIRKDDNGNERLSYSPVYTYYDLKGNHYRINSGARSIKKHESDQNTTVYYDIENPNIATASSFELYWAPFISISFTIICCLATFSLRKTKSII